MRGTGCGDEIATPVTAVLALALDAEVRLLDLDGRSERWTSAKTYVVDWSPDGRWLAALTLDDGGVLVVDDADTQERVFTARCDWTTPFAWSPDGARLAFRDGDYTGGGISIFDTGTGRVRALTSADSDDERPVWSPDGRRMLLHRRFSVDPYGSDDFKIVVADLETGARFRLTDNDEQTSEYDARFSSDGRWIAFYVWSSSSSSRVWAYGPGGQRLRGPGPRHGPLLPRPGSSEFLYGVAGETLQSARMILFDPDRDTEVELDRTDDYLGWWEDAVWSPDGRLIAFEDDRGNCNDFETEVYVYDVDRREKRLAATLPVNGGVSALAWSPDGDRLAVLASDCYIHTDQSHPDWGTKRSQVHAITVATGAIELLHVEPRLPSWDLAWRP